MPFPLLALPLELRESIYSLYSKPADHFLQSPDLEAEGYHGGVYKFETDLWYVNKQVYAEVKKVWRRENVFVKVATPWVSAGMLFSSYLNVNHISCEGLVPFVCTGTGADKFDMHHAVVRIGAPLHVQMVPEHTIVVLLDDLHLFVQTWHYSALSYPLLNGRLSCDFVLRDPNNTEAPEDTQGVSLALQQRLLLPFEQVKGLHKIDVSGYAPCVAAELERRMAIPIPTLQHCCESATELMVQGDAALADNKPLDALELYRKAFHAIHILISGRTRRVLGDVFFHEGIQHGRYAGQTGMTVRVILRLKLVSRTISAYLKTAQWGEAAYWGMRSIRIMGEAMDSEFEAFLSEFLGGADVGLIYVRTAVAFMKMEGARKEWEGELAWYAGDNIANSNSLWGLAVKYLKSQNKEVVRKELREYDVPQETISRFGDAEESVEEQSTRGHHGSDEE